MFVAQHIVAPKQTLIVCHSGKYALFMLLS